MGWCARASSWEVQSKWLSPLLNVLKTASGPRVARPGWHVDLFISKAFAKQPSRTSRSAGEAYNSINPSRLPYIIPIGVSKLLWQTSDCTSSMSKWKCSIFLPQNTSQHLDIHVRDHR